MSLSHSKKTVSLNEKLLIVFSPQNIFFGRAFTFSVLLTSNDTECKILKYRRAE